MFLLTHITIALFSVIYTAYTFLKPSATKLAGSYSLVGLTIGSGTYLVISMRANMVRACVTGLVYLAINIYYLAGAQRKFSLIKASGADENNQ